MDRNQQQQHNAFFRQLIFLGVLIVTALIIFKQLIFFIGAFLGAITIYIVFRNVFFRLTEQHKWKRWVASLTMVLAITIVLLGIGFLVFEVTASQIPSVDTSRIVTKFRLWIDEVNRDFGFKILSENILGQISGVLTKGVSTALNTTYSFAANTFMTLVILYFMFANARAMEAKILEYEPFKGESLEMVKQEVKNMIFSNAVVIPVVMFGQGLVATLIYWVLGVDNAVFWAFLTAFCGLIPMVGTAIVSVPLGIYMITSGGVWQGLVLIACGLLIIANVDNLIRIVMMQRVADTHPLIVIFGVILGIPLFGFWGIIFGPLLISGFLLLIKIYYREYGLLKSRKPQPPCE